MRPDDISLESLPLLEEDSQSSDPKSAEKYDPAEVLPADVFHLVLDRLPYTALVASAQVSRKWRKLADRDDHWEAELERVFPVDYHHAKYTNQLMHPRKVAFKTQYVSRSNHLNAIQKKLFHYCLEGNLEGVRSLIPFLVMPDLNVISGGKTALMLAAELGWTDILNLAYEKIVLPDYRDTPHNFPLLYYAIATQQPYDVMHAIIVETNSLEIPVGNNCTPLHVACQYGYEGRVRWLISRGANKNARTQEGYTPLHTAIDSDSEGVLEVVKLLIEAKANLVFPQRSEGSTPLHTACYRGREGVVRALLAAGCSPHLQNAGRTRPLYIASQYGHVKIVDLLLSAGAIVDHKRNGDYTALGAASKYGHAKIVQKLLAAGASVDHKDHHGERPLSKAIKGNHAAVVKILAPYVLQAIMKTKLEVIPDDTIQSLISFSGFFGVKLNRFLVYQAAFAMQEYIHGRLEASDLEEYRSTINWYESLKAIFEYYSQHPEIIEASHQNISDMLRNYFSPDPMAEKEKLAEKIHSICQEEKINVEAYLALALIFVVEGENSEESLLRGQSKFESVFIWLKSIDPGFPLAQKHLENWVNQAIIPKSIAQLFWQKIMEPATANCDPEVPVNEKGKEEEDENLSGLISLGR